MGCLLVSDPVPWLEIRRLYRRFNYQAGIAERETKAFGVIELGDRRLKVWGGQGGVE